MTSTLRRIVTNLGNMITKMDTAQTSTILSKRSVFEVEFGQPNTMRVTVKKNGTQGCFLIYFYPYPKNFE